MLNLEKKTLIMIGISVAAVIAFYFWWTYKRKNTDDSKEKKQEREKENLDGGTQPSPENAPVFVMFHATWCGHCVKALPEWDKFASLMQGKLMTKKIESAEPAIAQFQLSGFPTIRLFPRGLGDQASAIDYTGPRTAQGLMDFVNSIFGPPPGPQNQESR